MSMAGMIGLFRTRPLNPVGEDGRMSLGDHFRELRGRLMRSPFLLSMRGSQATKPSRVIIRTLDCFAGAYFVT